MDPRPQKAVAATGGCQPSHPFGGYDDCITSKDSMQWFDVSAKIAVLGMLGILFAEQRRLQDEMKALKHELEEVKKGGR